MMQDVKRYAERMALRAEEAKAENDRERRILQQKMCDLNIALDKIREECPHTKTINRPRASAETDSWIECLICGAVIE